MLRILTVVLLLALWPVAAEAEPPEVQLSLLELDVDLPRCPARELLTSPAGWQAGQAAAVLAWDAASSPEAVRGLREALLTADTAVLELPPTDGCATAAALRVLAAVAALSELASAGVRVAIGLGTAGPGVLAAAAAARADRLDGPAAAIAIGADGARYARGPAPSDYEAWPARAPLLCALLAPHLPRNGQVACAAALLAPTLVARLAPG